MAVICIRDADWLCCECGLVLDGHGRCKSNTCCEWRGLTDEFWMVTEYDGQYVSLSLKPSKREV